MLGDPHKQTQRFEAGIAAARAAGDQPAELSHLLNLGKFHYIGLRNAADAQECFQQALALSREINAQPQKMESHIGLGDCLYFSQEAGYEQSFEHYEQALKIALALGNREEEALCLTRMGMVESKLNNTQQALHHYEQALTIAREISHLRQQAITLEHMGRLYGQTGDYQQGVQTLEQAAAVYQSLGEETHGWFPAHCFGHIAHFCYQQGNMQQATDYYNRGLTLAREADPRCDNAFISQFRHKLVSLEHQLESQSWFDTE